MGPEPSLAITAVLLVGLVCFGFWWGWRQEQKALRAKAAEGRRIALVSSVGRTYADQHIKRRRSS